MIEFKSISTYSTILNPLKGFEEQKIEVETRYDPLLGERCDLCLYRAFLQFEKPDLNPIIERSMGMPCPFCPDLIEKVTPKFIPSLFPEGRIKKGEAWLIPNLLPGTIHNPLVVVSSDHFVGINEFHPEMLNNAISLPQSYIRRVEEVEGEVKHWSLCWNYMPTAGGSQLHPHIQVIGQNNPTPMEEKVINASRDYNERYGGVYFKDLVKKEKEVGLRYLGDTGDVSWIVNFVSRSWLFEIIAVFNKTGTLKEFSPKEFNDFSEGLVKVLDYCDSKNLYSFNMVLYSCNEQTRDYLPTYARFIPRFLYSPLQASDAAAGSFLHDWSVTFILPEDVCKEMKPFFEKSSGL
ncbi:MAG: hypothetical protein ABIJ37_06550 [Pseudomonadota bacterium]